MPKPINNLHVLFSADRKHIRKWSAKPFEGSTIYLLACSCMEFYGEDPGCNSHGEGTEWAEENKA